PRPPRSRTLSRMKKILFLLGVGLVLVAGLAFAGWYLFLKSDPEPRAAIKQTPLQTQVSGANSGNTASEGTSSALDGTYAVSPGNTDNFVGYRVTEKLVANVVESTATGRTDSVK